MGWCGDGDLLLQVQHQRTRADEDLLRLDPFAKEAILLFELALPSTRF